MKYSLSELITWYSTRRRKARLRRSPETFGMGYQDVVFPSANLDAVQLSGWFVPAERPIAAVILCHGNGGSRRGTLRKAVMLNRYHFTTLLFDFRASGKSSGRLRTLGLRETDDVLGAVAFLQKHPQTQNLPILVIGQSMGAAAAIRAAARCEAIKAVVAEASYAHIETLVRRRVRLCAGPFASKVARNCYRLGEQKLGKDILSLAPIEDIGKISPRPVMIIQDNLDLVCPRKEQKLLFEAANEPKELWIVKRATHTTAFRVAPREYERRVVGFLLRALHDNHTLANGIVSVATKPKRLQKLRNLYRRTLDWRGWKRLSRWRQWKRWHGRRKE